MNHYFFAIQAFIKTLYSLQGILDKAQTWSQQEGKSEAEILDLKLAPDMFNLAKQIQLTSDTAKAAGARLAGLEPPTFEDTEQSLSELKHRLSRTLEFLESFSEEQLAEADSQQIVLPIFSDYYQEAADYLRDFALPNFYFHVVTAYDILRHHGLNLGKADYIGNLNLKPRA
jgi:hypothetical protein